MPTYYSKICLYCECDFKVLPRVKNQRYCSAECVKASRARIQINSNCIECDNLLNKGQTKFCSCSCSSTYYNRDRKTLPVIECERCGGPTTNKHYCSFRCRFDWPMDENYIPKSKIIRKSKHLSNGTVDNTCYHCDLKFNAKSYQRYCDNCSYLYSHEGRAKYWFTINIFEYPELFDLESFKKIGFRSKDNIYGYTRDHKVSVNEAIRNNYDPYYIKHVMNCELMLWDENNRKNTNSSISYEELIRLVDEYDFLSKR